ncbi:hypothetical protein AC249_AIPGENE19637 [Exaiptasia diaphana]|nr:hypothetical protein AC249_AIPGENE19637 [Exaiptasia diaphana]
MFENIVNFHYIEPILKLTNDVGIAPSNPENLAIKRSYYEILFQNLSLGRAEGSNANSFCFALVAVIGDQARLNDPNKRVHSAGCF